MSKKKSKTQITITEALSKLKLINKKIDKKLYGEKAPLIDILVGDSNKGLLHLLTETELKKQASSYIDSIISLTEEKNRLKAAISRSNAITEIEVAGKPYTIVEIIERKNNLDKEKDFLDILQNQYANVINKVKFLNEEAQEKVDSLVQSRLSTDSKNQTGKETTELAKELFKLYEANIIDPIDIKKNIEKLSEEIESFENEVDVKLSIANAQTFIEI